MFCQIKHLKSCLFYEIMNSTVISLLKKLAFFTISNFEIFVGIHKNLFIAKYFEKRWSNYRFQLNRSAVLTKKFEISKNSNKKWIVLFFDPGHTRKWTRKGASPPLSKKNVRSYFCGDVYVGGGGEGVWFFLGLILWPKYVLKGFEKLSLNS